MVAASVEAYVMQTSAPQKLSSSARVRGVIPSPPPIRSFIGPGRPRSRAISVSRASQNGSLTMTLKRYSASRSYASLGSTRPTTIENIGV